jgi:hypothetical protein
VTIVGRDLALLAAEYDAEALARAISSIAALSLEFESEPWALQGQALTRFEHPSALRDDKPASRSEIETELRAELTALLDREQWDYEARVDGGAFDLNDARGFARARAVAAPSPTRSKAMR